MKTNESLFSILTEGWREDRATLGQRVAGLAAYGAALAAALALAAMLEA